MTIKVSSWNQRTPTLSGRMPRYFCDFESNGQVIPDNEGSELAGVTSARDEALVALAAIVPSALSAGDRRKLAVNVRDEEGSLVLKVVLPLEMIWPH
jgi:hypothetical protein